MRHVLNYHFVLSLMVALVTSSKNLAYSNEPKSTSSDTIDYDDREPRVGIKKEWFPIVFCKSGFPLLRSKFCNGKIDCIDGSDETSEQCRINKCKNDNFRCDYGGCISRRLACNGVYNCADGSDEKSDVCKAINCVIPFPANDTVYFVPGCDDCRSGSRAEEGSVLQYQCTNNNTMETNESRNIICRNGVWSPSLPVCSVTSVTMTTASNGGANDTTSSASAADATTASSTITTTAGTTTATTAAPAAAK